MFSMPFWSWNRKKLLKDEIQHTRTGNRIGKMWQNNDRIVMFGFHWWAFQQRFCRKIWDWWKVNDMSTIPAIYISCLLISGGRALLGTFLHVWKQLMWDFAASYSLSLLVRVDISPLLPGHWELRLLWLMPLSMRHDPLCPYEPVLECLRLFTSFFQLGLNSVYVRCHMAPWDLIATFEHWRYTGN